jgi:hypothetical protein
VLIPCILLWLQLYTVGLLNEGRSSARRLEWLRLLVAVPAVFLLWWAGVDGMQQYAGAWMVVVVYSIASAAWLARISSADQLPITQ